MYSGSPREILEKNLPKPINGFTLSFWINIESFFFKDGLWRHILHRGDLYNNKKFCNWKQVSQINQSLGVWLHPDDNTIRFCFKADSRLNMVDLQNVPINIPFCITIVIEQNSFNLYLNGKLSKSLVYNQNIKTYGNLFLFQPYSFIGEIQDFVYYNEPVSTDEANTLCERKKIKL